MASRFSRLLRDPNHTMVRCNNNDCMICRDSRLLTGLLTILFSVTPGISASDAEKCSDAYSYERTKGQRIMIWSSSTPRNHHNPERNRHVLSNGQSFFSTSDMSKRSVICNGATPVSGADDALRNGR